MKKIQLQDNLVIKLYERLIQYIQTQIVDEQKKANMKQMFEMFQTNLVVSPASTRFTQYNAYGGG